MAGIDPALARMSATEPPLTDEPILPPSYSNAQLVEAIGGKKRKPRKGGDDDFDEPGRKKRRTVTIAALSILTALVVIAFAFLGRANSQRFLITCTTDSISPQQGRSFPPWGSKPLPGAEWKQISLPPNAECKPRETDDRAELEGWYLEMLLDRASTTLTQKNLLEATAPAAKGGANPLDVAAEQLNQALLLSRNPARRDQRKEVERLLGDVQYWRAAGKLREATIALETAAKQFDAASGQRPRHVTDASGWATFLHKVVGDLKAGPNGAPAPTTAGEPEPERPSAPMGTQLPIEPQGSDATDQPPPQAVDAGVPSGGVLL